jgi:hypothetical protein
MKANTRTLVRLSLLRQPQWVYRPVLPVRRLSVKLLNLRTDAQTCIPGAPKVDGVNASPDGGIAPVAFGHGQGMGSGTGAYLDAGPCQRLRGET